MYTAFWHNVLSSEKYNKLHHREEMPAHSVFERCRVSFLWLSLKVEELCGLIWDIWVQLTYYYNLLPLLKENRDTWLYILHSIICSSSLLYFVLRIFLLFFLRYIYSSFVSDLQEKVGVLFLDAEIEFIISEVIIISFLKYDSIYQNCERQKAGLWRQYKTSRGSNEM